MIPETYKNPKVLKRLDIKSKSGRSLALFQCFCGKSFKNEIRRNNSPKSRFSCGCLKNKDKITHNRSDTSEYNIWNTMRARCNNPKSKKYKIYGARGIKVCDEWENSFENFYKDMGPRPGKEYSIHRINNSLGYSKENCKWATAKEQAEERNTTIYLTFNGVTKKLVEWSKELSISQKTLRGRLYKNWTHDKILSTPIRKVNK